MATYNVVRSKSAVLVAATVDVINFSDYDNAHRGATIRNSGTVDIFARFDGVDPVVNGDENHKVPAGDAIYYSGVATQVRLISSGTPAYEVVVGAQEDAPGTPPTGTVTANAGAAVRSGPTAMQTAAVANGNGNSLNVNGYAAAVVSIVSSVAMSGGTTINFEASVDDVTWVPIAGHQMGALGALAVSTTTDGDFRFAVAGYKSLRARISGYSAGTIGINGYAAPAASQPTAVASVPTPGAPFVGQHVGVVADTALASVPAKYVQIKAQKGNTGNVYVGGAGVTKPSGGGVVGATDATAGFPLAAGESTGWMASDNLSRFHVICDSVNDNVSFAVIN